MTAELRGIALRLLDGAYRERNAIESRLWAAQATVEVTAKELVRAQDFLDSVWSDLRPELLGGDADAETPESGTS